MRNTEKINIRPVDATTWKDFETLFKSKGAPAYCWCMAWRMTKDELKQNTSSNRKKFIRKRVSTGVPIGLLGYDGDEPIAWCSIAPRETYQRLGGDERLDSVWSIACFFIKKEYRNHGLVHLLIKNAIKYAKENGGKYLEAYPVDADSPSYRFMGFVDTFKKAEFTFVKKAGSRRNVMVRKI
jgi:GNAT superfamily N-acetyltransferase